MPRRSGNPSGTGAVTEENSNKKSGAASPDKASKEETNSDKVVSGKQSEKVALAAAPEALVEKTTAEDRPALEIGHSCTFTLEYKDEGSGGNRDISIYDPKLENGFRSIGSYAQGNYNSPKGCITVVKALVDKLHNGKPPLMDPAGYDLIWKDENSGANMDGSIWQPRAPDNDYVCLGSVGQTGYAQPHISGYACVHKCLVQTETKALTPLWTDEGTGATSQVSIFQLPASQTIVALPGHNAPGTINELNTTGMCQ